MSNIYKMFNSVVPYYFILQSISTSTWGLTAIRQVVNDSSSKAWPPLCLSGKLQSPINLPQLSIPEAFIPPLQIRRYRNSFFRMRNNGHSVQIDFVGKSGHNEGLSSYPILFPDPLNLKIWRQYKFSAAHFHWGDSDYVPGSEHCIAGKCSAFEIHFVHYLANYPNMSAAISSGNENALTVLAVLVDVSATKTMGNNLFSIIFQSSTMPTFLDGCFGPIAKRLGIIQYATQDQYLRVPEELDLANCIKSENHPLIYSYKGSLTTPGCEEQVNWFIFKNPSTTSHQNLATFKRLLKDSFGKTLATNHRPLQALNGRKVRLFMVNK